MAKKTEVVDSDYNYWIGQISAYERQFKKWEGRVKKIVKRYRDESGRDTRGYQEAHFNILWSNVQTLCAATFSKLPKPDVSRRFKDQDPVGRVASNILERALEYEIQKYTDFSCALQASIEDRFLGGRGTCWLRYEPHFRAKEQNLPTDGDQISSEQDESDEELDYECAPCDYVQWTDFGHTNARTWDEVDGVWRIVYLDRKQCVERFGEDLGNKIPLDSMPDSSKNDRNYDPDDPRSRAKIYEIWCKSDKEALWLSKSLGKIIDRKDDPLGLDEFFPCPKPLYATTTNDRLEPVPDFTLYQDQARSLDIIADRVDGLIKGMKIMGVYDPSVGDLARIFQEGENNTLIPAKNWAKFAEKGGLKGSLELVDISPLAAALKEQYLAFESVKSQIYEITGIADIIRGQTDPNETLGAQQIKGNYASLRLKSYQDEVAEYATEILRIKAQIICNKFSAKTIAMIAAVDQLSPTDQQYVPMAGALLIGQERMTDPNAEPGPNPLRMFRIEVDADTLVYLDEEQEKQSRVEFINAVGDFISKLVQVPPSVAPFIAPLAMELLKFGVTGFKVGKGIEGKIDEWTDGIVKAVSQPQQQPQINPADMIKAHVEQQKGQMALQTAQVKGQAEVLKAKSAMQTEQLDSNADIAMAQAKVMEAQARLEEARLKASQPRQPLQNQRFPQ